MVAEAEYLYRRLFGSPAPDEVIERYVWAVAQLLPGDLPRRKVDMSRVVERRLDPDAVELYLRVRHRGPNELGQRLHILLYLAELRPERFSSMTLTEPRRLRAWLGLVAIGLGLPFRLIKGWFQTARHRISPGGEPSTSGVP